MSEEREERLLQRWTDAERQKAGEERDEGPGSRLRGHDGRPRTDMSTWTVTQEMQLMRELRKAQRYLAENGQDVSVEELRRYWGVANAYEEDERNEAVSFAVHAIFASVPDRAVRQEMLHSRDDWTEETAQAAVYALDRLTAPDSESRRRAHG